MFFSVDIIEWQPHRKSVSRKLPSIWNAATSTMVNINVQVSECLYVYVKEMGLNVQCAGMAWNGFIYTHKYTNTYIIHN